MTGVRTRALAAIAALGAIVIGTLTAVAPAQAAPTAEVATFSYTGSLQTFTVPAGVTSLTITATGAEGGLGGRDSQGEPIPGGYKGQVTGTISVTPGQVLTVSVGGGGTRGASSTSSQSRAAAGVSPLSGYAGGQGGMPGGSGSSGGGGGGGAATVVTTADSTVVAVAAGAGGGGGSGQWTPLVGRQAEPNHSPRPDSTTGVGQNGFDVMAICSNNCDGGGSGAGGGGWQGGARGTVEFGTGTYTEWLGYGGYPGSNYAASGLSGSYVYFPGNSAGGSVRISYTTGSADAPTAVVGAIGDSEVDLSWTAPANTGGAAISDYVIQYAVSSATPSWQTFTHSASSATSATVTGLTNGTSYIFRVAATNSFGTGGYSANSDAVSPSGVPSAPALTSLAAGDARLVLGFTPAASGASVLGYEYQLDGGAWSTATGTTSPITIGGLVNGTPHSVALRAVNVIGTGPASDPLTGTPIATPGAPVIESVTAGVGSAAIAFSAGFDGGAEITGYEYRVDGGAWQDAGTSSPVTVTGLGNGATASLQLRAQNSSGAGAPSAAISVTTPSVPRAPVLGTVTRGDRALTVPFTPAADGGSAITDYQYRIGSGAWVSAGTASSPIRIDGLTNGASTDVALRAVNAVGNGTASATATATPATVPGAPSIVGGTVSGTDATLSAAFTAPASDGGSAITTYEYSTDGGATWRARESGTTESPLVITALSGDGTTPLENGTEYFVEVRAVNDMGAGTDSGVAPGIARTTPSAPTITAARAGDGTIAVTFAPASNGGAPITKYEYRIDSGAWTTTGSLSSTFVLSGLDNGTSYSVAVRARNSEGSGAASGPATATPRTLPGQPTTGTVLPSDRTLTVAVDLPNNGGSPVTAWEYTTDGGTTWHAAAATSTPLVITALSTDGTTRLVNGDSYPVAVRAANAAGAGSASAVRTLSPRAVPAQPTTALTALNGALSAAFTVADDGGSPITRIDYRLGGGDWTSTGSLASPFVIPGLTNGTAYSVEVRAVNAAGPSAVAAARTGTPRAVPNAPTAVAVAPGDASADVSWTAPADNGGSAITRSVATAWSTATSTTAVATCTTADTSCTITGLTNTSTYYVSVVAENAAGASVASSPRVAVVPLAKPAAPTLTSLTAANSYLTLAFTAGSAGSRAITGYEYRLNGGAWLTASSTSSPLTLNGLTNGTAYTVALRAVSSAGAGVASSTLTATPYTLPTAPDSATIVAEPASGSAVVSWTAPNANGSAITAYSVVAWSALTQGSQVKTCAPANVAVATCTLTGLTNGTTYYVTIDATNAAGTSTRSTPRVPVVYTGAPGRPAALAGTAADSSVSLSWTAGTAGTSATTDYTVWYKAQGASSYTQFADGTSTATSATVTGLVNGTSYSFVVYAVNSAGTSIASAAASGITPFGQGTVPALSSATRTAGGFDFSITNYSANVAYSFAATNGATATRSGSSVTVTGLSSSAASTVTVTATRTGYTTTTEQISATALASGVAPALSAPSSAQHGFSLRIENFGADSYEVATTAGTAELVDDVVTVTGLADGESATVTVTVSRPGYAPAATSATGAAMAAIAAPTFGTPVSTADGFVIALANQSSDNSYSVATSAGSATLSGSTITVAGLAPGATATVTVTASRAGHVDGVASASGDALAAGEAPVLSAGDRTVDGFEFTLESPDAAASYVFGTTAGTVTEARTTTAGTVMTVSGLTPGHSATVTVTAVRAGSTDGVSSILGTALDSGAPIAPGSPRPALDGFAFDIQGYDAGSAYTVTTTAGTATEADGVVTVTGLAEGESATVTITATRAAHTDSTLDVTATALITGTAPALSVPASTTGGFTLEIENFSSSASYTVTATGGSTVSLTGSTVTVTGVAAGVSSTVEVTASRTGYTTAAASVSGSALPAPAAPAPEAPAAPAAPDAPAAPAPAPTPTKPTTSPDDYTPAKPGAAASTVGGVPVATTVKYTAGTVTVTANGITVEVQAPTGQSSTSASILSVRQGDELGVGIWGFKPRTMAEMWGHSTPTFLGTVIVDDNHEATSDFALPSEIGPGEHTLVINGFNEAGEAVSVSVGFVVLGDEQPVATTAHVATPEAAAGASWLLGWNWLLVVPVVVLVALLFWLIARRRRRDDDEDSVAGEVVGAHALRAL